MTSTVPRVSPNDGDVVRFPFSAVVGHDDLRLALLLNAVHPGVGGVLVRGEKGTAKSTAVRALAALLPAVTVVPDCRFSCDPAAPDPRCPDGPHQGPLGVCDDRADSEVRRRDGLALLPPPAVHARPARLVELPVGATEDRLVGSLDLERALADGVRAYQPGLLADAHRGVLYVDEVNLLHDHLVDLLLDAAAMGRAHVERDGVSVSHAASFLLVGTMNPEEGELRPQLLDRFGLTVEVRASRDVETRVEVVGRRMAFEADPAAFVAAFAEAEGDTARRIADARVRLGSVVLPDAELRRIAAVCAAFDVDGMRADLVIARAAAAHAAWRGADAVAKEDVRAAARLALPHRRRRDPFDEPGMDEQALDEALDGADPEPEPDGPDPDGPGPDGRSTARDGRRRTARRRDADGASTERRGAGQVRPGRAARPVGAGPARASGRRRSDERRAPAVDAVPGPAARGPGSRARVRPAAGRGPAPTPAGSSVPPTGRRAAPRSCTCRPPSRPPHRTSGSGAGPAAGCCSTAATCAAPSGRAARATSCCSPSTPPGRWPHASGCRPSPARCCRCCATRTSAATRSGC